METAEELMERVGFSVSTKRLARESVTCRSANLKRDESSSIRGDR
jgi:hypothetical protein